MERTRRKIAVAFQGEEVHAHSHNDAEIEAAVLAAKRTRDELMRANREMFARQDLRKRQAKPRGFEGPLEGAQGSYTLHSSSAEPGAQMRGLEPRMSHGKDVQLPRGENQPQPFPGVELVERERSEWQRPSASRETSATVNHTSGHAAGSEPLIHIGSEPRSETSSPAIATPTRTLSGGSSPRQRDAEGPSSAYFPINEWAEHTTQLSPPPRPRAIQIDYLDVLSQSTSNTFSGSDSGDDIANDVTEERNEGRPFDVLSDTSGIRTPGTWTEVGSEISEGDLGH